MKIIPQELIDRWAWTPDKKPIVKEDPKIAVINSSVFSVEAMLKGKDFYSDKKDGSMWVGVPVALQGAMNNATSKGIVLTMPEMINAKCTAKKNHRFWKEWYTVLTEENIGPDYEGKFLGRGEHALIVVHGGGILTPDRINRAYSEGLISNSARYTEEEFAELLEGKLADGSVIPMFHFEDFKKMSEVPRTCGVVMPYELAQSMPSGYQEKEPFLKDHLVLARSTNTPNLEKYFDKAKDPSDNTLGNHHVYNGRNADTPQGRLLYLDDIYCGLDGSYSLDNIGRFVGVAPEAP